MNQRPPPKAPVDKNDPTQIVNALLVQQKQQILAALPKHMQDPSGVARFTRIALTEMRRNPKLAMCEPRSILGAVIQSAQLGLEIGSGLGHAYLVPFKNPDGVMEAQFIPGYKGLIDLAMRSGRIETFSARIVREGDIFEFEYGDEERIRHAPSSAPVMTKDYEGNDITRPIIAAYAIVRIRGGGIQREVMSREQLEWIRERKKVQNPVWETDFDEMARKTVVRRISKYLQLSPEMARAIEADNSNFNGESQRNWEVIDADFVPVPPQHDPAKANAEREAAGKEAPVDNLLADAKRQAALKTLRNVRLKANALIDWRRVQNAPKSDVDWEKFYQEATVTVLVTMTDLIEMAISEANAANA